MALEGHITVSTNELRSQSEEVRNQLHKMEDQFASLKDTINRTAAYWTGEAGDAHRKQYMNRISQIDEMFTRYKEHAVDLEKMAGIYEEAEAKALNAAEDMPASEL